MVPIRLHFGVPVTSQPCELGDRVILPHLPVPSAQLCQDHQPTGPPPALLFPSLSYTFLFPSSMGGSVQLLAGE